MASLRNEVSHVGAPHVGAATTSNGSAPPLRSRERRRWTRGRSLAVLAIAAFALAGAAIQQPPGPSQTSHFALVRALASGTAEIGPGISIDTSYINEAYFANKAPGLAFTILPAYVALRAVGLQASERRFESRLWQVTLFGALLPAVVLLALVVVAVEPVVPGYGALTALLLGAGTMLLPLSMLLFGHVLSATLGFAAFVVLARERRHGPSSWLTGAAGLLAGFAVAVEYPLGIVMVVLLAYVAFGERVAPRLGAYAAGCVAGIVPLLAYNTWAFGSPTVLSYTNSITGFSPDGGPPSLGSGNSTAFYGVSLPDPRVVLSLLVSEKGLLVVAPICLVALLGIPAMWRSGRRAETLVCCAVPALFLAYNAAYYIPFGGQGPGPRFLTPALPFLALPLALALRRRLFLGLALGLASIVVMTVAAATNPLTGEEHGMGTWFDALGAGRIVDSAISLGHWGTLALFAALLVLAVAAALACARPEAGALRPTAIGVLALAAWLVTALVAPHMLPANADHGTLSGTLAVLGLLVAVGAGLVLASRGRPLVAVTLAPLALLALPQVYTRQNASLLVTVVVLGLLVLAERATRVSRTASAAVLLPVSGAAEATPLESGTQRRG